MAEFNGSIAQVNVQFPIETVIEPIAGENYSRAVIFAHVNLASENLPNVTTPTAGQKIELDSSSYASITGGLLKKWLVPFFTSATTAKVAVVLYDTDTTTTTVDPDTQEETTTTVEATCPLSKAYEKFKYYGYFKFALAELSNYVSVQKELASLCLVDPLYSTMWVGTSDTNVLKKTSTLITELNSVNANVRVIYNPNAEINPALAQLGDTLAVVNSTGTPIGNDIDGHAFSTINASGSLDSDGNYTNLTATEKATLDEQKIGYNTAVGDGTDNVVTEGSLTLTGEVVGANWVKAYIEYLCKVKCANYITQRNKFRNNAEYQGILTMMSAIIKPFIDFGRLADYSITAPTFSQLPKSADSFTVANAWEATYIDRLRSVVVYGTLYVTTPSK